MTRKELSRMLEKTSLSPGDIPLFFQMLLESRRESETTKREGKKYEAMRDVMIREIGSRYGFYQYCFSQIFAERRGVILKDFEVIDKGMRENNRDLISDGLASLAQVVSSSPLREMEKFRSLFDLKINEGR
jgi:hypothetical protein